MQHSVRTGGRLVHEEDGGHGDQLHANAHTLALATRDTTEELSSDTSVLHVADAKDVQHHVDTLTLALLRKCFVAAEARAELQSLLDSELGCSNMLERPLDLNTSKREVG